MYEIQYRRMYFVQMGSLIASNYTYNGDLLFHNILMSQLPQEQHSHMIKEETRTRTTTTFKLIDRDCSR